VADNNTRIIISADDQASPALRRVGAELGNLGQSIAGMSGVMGALSGAAVASGFIAMTKAAIDFGGKLNDMAMQTGATVEQLSAMRNVAEQSGVSLDEAGKGLQALSKKMFAAATGNKEAAATFEALGVSIKDGNGALRDSGLVMQDVAKSIAGIASPTERVAAAQLAMTKSSGDLVPMLMDIANGAEMVATWTKKDAEMADELGDNFTKLAAQARGAGESLARELIQPLNEIAKAMLDTAKSTGELSAGTAAIKTFFETIAVLGVNVAYVFNTVGKELGGMAAQLVALSTLDFKGFTAIGDAMKKDAAAARKEIDALSERILNPSKDSAPAATKTDTGNSFAARLNATNEAGKKVKATIDELAVAMNKIYAKDSGLDVSYLKDLQTLHAGYKAGRLDLAQYQDAVGKLTTSQKFHVDALKASADAEKLWADAVEKAAEAAEKTLKSLDERAIAAENELETYGLTKSAIEDTIIARLEEQRAMVNGFDSQVGLVANLEKEIVARKKARDAFRGLEAKEDAKKAADDATKAWDKFADDIEKGLTDSLYRSFESGKGFSEAFVDSLKNTLKTTVLKLAVQAVVDPIMGTVRSAMGGAGGAGNALSMGSSLWNAYSTGDFAATGYGAFATSSVGASLGLSTPVVVDAVAGLAAPTAVTGGMTALGTAMPYIAAALLIASALEGGETRQGGVSYLYGKSTGDGTGIYNDYGTSGITAKFGSSGGPIQGIQELTGQTVAGINTLFKSLGSSATLAGFQAGAETSGNGRGGVFSGGTLSTGARFGEAALGSNYSGGKYESTSAKDGDAKTIAKNFGEDMLQVTIQALQAATDLPASISKYLQGVDAEALSGEAAANIISTITALSDLSKPLPDIMESARIAGLSAFGAWQNGSDALLNLARQFDGSLNSANALTGVIQARYAQELQLVQQIQTAMAGTGDMFAASIRSIRLSVLDDPAKFNYLDREAQKYRDLLATMLDPELISKYAGKLNETINQSFGLLAPDEQKARAGDYVALLESADKLAQDRYQATANTIVEERNAFTAAVQAAVTNAVEQIAAAAAKPQTVVVDVNVNQTGAVETVAYTGP
jgi:hypothetical protein